MDFTWKIFCMTGNIDTYLIMKEMEKEHALDGKQRLGHITEPEVDSTLH